MSDLLGTLKENPLKCIDVGARGGLQGNWRPFKALLFTDAFEPDEEACRRESAAKRGGEHWFPFGLGARTERAKIYVLKKPSGSSLYPPNPEVMKMFAPRNFGDLDKVIEVDVMGLSDFIEKYGRNLPNLIKLDIQGAELDVLKSLRKDHWRDLLALQVEVEFIPYYIGQPLFSDVDAFVKEQGFALFDLLPNRYYRVEGGIPNYYLKRYLNLAKNRRDISCRMVAGDALYFRPAADVLESRNKALCLKYFMILAAYKCLDEALWFTGQLLKFDLVVEAEAEELRAFVQQIAPRPKLWQRADWIGKLTRRIYRRLNIGRARKPDYWLDRSWDY